MAAPPPDSTGGSDPEALLFVKVALPVETPLPPAEGANFFQFSTVEGEVQFVLGMVNLTQMVHAKSLPGSVTIVPQVTHRFTLSTFAFHQLRFQIERIAQNVPATGAVFRNQPSE